LGAEKRKTKKWRTMKNCVMDESRDGVAESMKMQRLAWKEQAHWNQARRDQTTKVVASQKVDGNASDLDLNPSGCHAAEIV
jgi:hypothetical protein